MNSFLKNSGKIFEIVPAGFRHVPANITRSRNVNHDKFRTCAHFTRKDFEAGTYKNMNTVSRIMICMRSYEIKIP